MCAYSQLTTHFMVRYHIKYIVLSPYKNALFSDCFVEDENSIDLVKLSTDFEIKSVNNTEYGKQAIQDLFSKYSFFYNQTNYLLYDYFEFESIEYDIITNTTIITKTEHIKRDSFADKYIIYIVIGCVAFILFICLVLLILYRRYKALQKAAMILRNPMVILLAIGDYDEDPQNPDPELGDGEIEDLKVDVDIKNLRRLFHDKLQYETMPQYEQYPRIHWTQKEIIDFCKEKAKILEDNISSNTDSRYDGLILTVSAHGMDNNIITSDYKLVDKDAIHRIFSTRYPQSRDIPRIMMFDCCDGPERIAMKGKKKKNKKNDTDKDETESKYDTVSKKYDVGDILVNEPVWRRGDKNPDYKLATIHAANPGFQAIMSSISGSYMITKFVEKTLDALKGGNDKFLYEIFDEIQNELSVRKQQIVLCV